MALDFSTLRRPANPQVVDPSTGRMREEWQLYFDQLTTRLNGAVGVDTPPTDAEYLVGASNGVLTAERVVTDTTSITWDLATAGQAKAKRAALTGDVTASADSNATTIANGAVTVAKVDAGGSGNRWGVVPIVAQGDGVMEVGRILDFHDSDGDTSDFSIRVRSDDIGSGTNLSLTPSAGADAGVVKRMVAARNSTLAQGDVLYYDGTNFVRLAAGTSGQFLKTNGAAANPAWESAPGAIVAIIEDQKASGTNGGTFTSGADRTRDLTTLVYNRNSLVSLSSNQFTLPAGSWEIEWSAPTQNVNQHQTILRDVTAGADLSRGVTERTGGNNVSNSSLGSFRVTPSSSNTYEIRHRCQTTAATTGFGQAGSFGTEVYTRVVIRTA